MRSKQWADPETKRILWTKMVTEGATAIGLGVCVISAGTWWHVELPVLAGISVFAGWLGPAAVSDYAMKKLGIKP